MRRAVVVLASLLLLFLLVRWGVSMSSTQPAVGLTESGQLRPCPSSPNCIASHEEGQLGRLDPLRFTGAPAEAMAQLEQLVRGMPRTRVVTRRPEYLHVEFRSRLFRFVDDVEFLLDANNQTIHFRSASRLGHSDLGANRQRMERIKAIWMATQEK